jgi:KUP system potassium uptake protein
MTSVKSRDHNNKDVSDSDYASVPKGLALAASSGRIDKCDLQQVTYYTGHETIIASARRLGMTRWREEIFAFMHHNAQRPGAYFKIPSTQIMEIGLEFEI